jgi:putative hydrolase of the HAD superfamily
MATINAVLFDYGMVLSGPPDKMAWERMQAILKDGKARLEDGKASLTDAYWRHRDAYDRGLLTAEAYWGKVASELGVALAGGDCAALIQADLDHWGQPNPETIGWASRLQRAGIRTGVLSNLGDAMEAGLAARFPWLQEFAHRTYSHRLGIAKPDLAIYRHATEGLGVPAGEILFLDDREENVAGARAAGMQAIRYQGHPGFVAEMIERGWGGLLAPVARRR